MIVAKQRTVYFSSFAGRHYQTKHAAIIAEAKKIIEAKYPTEPYEWDTGAGFHWQSEIERSHVLLRRVARLVKQNMQKAIPAQPAKEETK